MTTHNILKTAVCESISGRSTLTYQLGHEANSESFCIRIIENTGNGYFCENWLRLNDLIDSAKTHPHINSFTINQMFNGKSVNTGAFLIAALKQEKLIQHSPNSKRSFVINDESTLIDELTKLANKPKSKGVKK